MDKEIWKDIPDYEGLYQVSNLGRVKSMNYNHTYQEKILKNRPSRRGYLHVVLWKNKTKHNYSVHRLVLIAFIGKSNLVINHKDENTSNNRLENLEYCTQQYNAEYSNAKPVQQYTIDGIFIKEWKSIISVINELNIRNISQACRGIRKSAGGYIWKYKEETSND